MRILCKTVTHQGLVRTSNEDSCLIDGWVRTAAMLNAHTEEVTHTPLVVAVADGLGGHAGGAVASGLALARIATRTAGLAKLTEATIGDILRATHADLLELSGLSLNFRGMGTTVAGLAVQGDEAIIFNIGDSRVYRREGDFLQLLTVDDRLSGEREFGEAKEAAATNVLLQCLGAQRTSESPIAHFNTLPLGALETFLVCTDGVSDVVSLDDIEACMRNPSRRCVEDLAAAVLAAGAPDNFSIIEVRIIDGATLACTGKT